MDYPGRGTRAGLASERTAITDVTGQLPEWVRRRLDPAQRYGLRVTLFAIAVILVLGPFGILVREVVAEGGLTRVDLAAARNLHKISVESPLLVAVMEVVSFVGSPLWFYIVLGAMVLWLWIKHRRRLAVFVTVTALMGGVVDTAVKIWVDRPRPILENPVATAPANSFPSGHAMTSTIGYGLMLLVFLPLVPRRWRRWVVAGAAALVLLIGYSRLALGVHFITDIVGGIILGLAWLAAATAAFSIWRTEEGKPPVRPLEGAEPESMEGLRSSDSRS
jgi:membrane-associated phospholipid phosphatase